MQMKSIISSQMILAERIKSSVDDGEEAKLQKVNNEENNAGGGYNDNCKMMFIISFL